MRFFEYLLYLLSIVCFGVFLWSAYFDLGFTRFYVFSSGELGEFQRSVLEIHNTLGRWLYLLTLGLSIVFAGQGYILRKLRKFQFSKD